MRHVWTVFGRHKSAPIVLIGFLVLAVVIGSWLRKRPAPAGDISSATVDRQVNAVSRSKTPEELSIVAFPRDSWPAAALELNPVERRPFAQTVELTGKIALNEDRLAHIFPLVDGRVDEVKIQLGNKVKKGDLLVIVQSTDVGRSMLQLYQNRLQREFAVTKDRWTQTVAANTQAMIQLMRGGATIDEIEKQLTDRPMGEYRDKLMSAYVAHYKARKHLDRLTPLSEGGSIAGKQLLEAESEWNATRATLQSLLEQYQQETQQSSAMSLQSVKELDTRVSVDETNLRVLGVEDSALAVIDPIKQGESISHYPITSPFDGTIISKDVVLLERVGPERQILSIADLSTVWVTTDIYEEHLPLLEQLENRTIQLRSPAWADKQFEARIFYTGDLVNESSRTVAMRAIADNRDGHLKPGMFVTVEFPGVSRPGVIQVPLAAVLEHAGKSFVFVHRGENQFERRDVTLGLRNAQDVEVKSGLKPDESVVTHGGFALKSRMLAELLSE